MEMPYNNQEPADFTEKGNRADLKTWQGRRDFALLARGDKKEWDIFVKEVSPVVFSMIRRTLASAGHGQEEAYDLLQEVFIKLCRDDFRILKRYNPGRASISTWLCLVARNIAMDYLRRKRPATCSLENVPEPAEEPGLSDRDTPHIPLEKLPPRQALVMKLLYEREMDVREVAVFLGISQQTVRSMKHKAIKKLRRVSRDA